MPRADVSMSAAEIESFFQAPRVGVLATIGRDGTPHQSGMWYVRKNDGLRMWTYGKSQKALNARRDPRGSLLLEEGDGYNTLRGLSVRGALRVVDDFDEVRAIGIALYERYTQPRLGIPVQNGPIVEIERQAKKRVGLILSIEDVASWDHSKLS